MSGGQLQDDTWFDVVRLVERGVFAYEVETIRRRCSGHIADLVLAIGHIKRFGPIPDNKFAIREALGLTHKDFGDVGAVWVCIEDVFVRTEGSYTFAEVVP